MFYVAKRFADGMVGRASMPLSSINSLALSSVWGFLLASAAGVLLTLFWLAATAGALYLWRALLPRPVSLLRWLWAYGRSVCLFARVYAASVGATGIAWRGIRYVVGRGGVVRETSRQ